MFAKIQRIHFVGIGGIGMSGIAEVLLNLGYKISGSDLKRSPVTERLRQLGAIIFDGHGSTNIAGAEVVVTSSAINIGNPEVEEARRLHVPVIPRAEMLAELMRLKYGIAIAGMHGKTTTTSMVAAVLAAGRLDPTVVVGGRVDAMGSNARLGRSQYLVAEADESDRSFLKLSPILAVVTNIDREHMDCYRSMHDVKRAFLDFMDRVPFYGMIVACNDDPILRRLFPKIRRRMLSYGTRKESDFRIKALKPFGVEAASAHVGAGALTRPPRRGASGATCFGVTYRGRDLDEFRLHVPGLHNVLNATAAIAVGIGLDIPVPHIQEALENFSGVDRRFQVRGHAAGVTVIDDYGHHPTEIRATLAAARQCGYRKIHVIFQPHRYTRTRDLFEDFVKVLSTVDALVLVDVYPAGEAPIVAADGRALVRAIRVAGRIEPVFVEALADVPAAIRAIVRDGDVVVTMGAGSIGQVPSLLAAA